MFAYALGVFGTRLELFGLVFSYLHLFGELLPVFSCLDLLGVVFCTFRVLLRQLEKTTPNQHSCPGGTPVRSLLVSEILRNLLWLAARTVGEVVVH